MRPWTYPSGIRKSPRRGETTDARTAPRVLRRSSRADSTRKRLFSRCAFSPGICACFARPSTGSPDDTRGESPLHADSTDATSPGARARTLAFPALPPERRDAVRCARLRNAVVPRGRLGRAQHRSRCFEFRGIRFVDRRFARERRTRRSPVDRVDPLDRSKPTDQKRTEARLQDGVSA